MAGAVSRKDIYKVLIFLLEKQINIKLNPFSLYPKKESLVWKSQWRLKSLRIFITVINSKIEKENQQMNEPMLK